MKKIIASLGLAMGTMLCAAPASADIVVAFTPSTQHANIGDTVTVDVSISGLGDEILAGFDLNFFYNGSVIGGNARAFDGTSAYGQLGHNFVPAVDPIFAIDGIALGEWGVQANALADDDIVAANQADAFLLFQFSFSADADGVSMFSLGGDLDFERNFVGRRFETLNVTVGSACIAVGTGVCSTVPEPSSYTLAGLALAGALLPGALRRRRENKG